VLADPVRAGFGRHPAIGWVGATVGSFGGGAVDVSGRRALGRKREDAVRAVDLGSIWRKIGAAAGEGYWRKNGARWWR
jgi:hypothetical protein